MNNKTINTCLDISYDKKYKIMMGGFFVIGFPEASGLKINNVDSPVSAKSTLKCCANTVTQNKIGKSIDLNNVCLLQFILTSLSIGF